MTLFEASQTVEAGIPISMVVSAVAGTMTLMLTALVALIRYNFTTREGELVRRIELCEQTSSMAVSKAAKAAEAFSARVLEYLERVHRVEMDALRQQSSIQLVDQKAGAVIADVEEIKDKMVTKDAFDASMRGIIDTLRRIEADVRGGSRKLPQESSPPVLDRR